MTKRGPNQKIAQIKADLRLTLRALCAMPSQTVIDGPVQLVRAWLEAQKSALSVIWSSRSSVNTLRRAVDRMSRAGAVESVRPPVDRFEPAHCITSQIHLYKGMDDMGSYADHTARKTGVSQ